MILLQLSFKIFNKFMVPSLYFLVLCHLANLHNFQALKELPREKVQLATKIGSVKFDNTSIIIDGTPESVRSCCEASLKRLEVEYIGLYYQHRIDTSVPIEDTVS